MEGTDGFHDDLGHVGLEHDAIGWESAGAVGCWLGSVGAGGGGVDDVVCGSSGGVCEGSACDGEGEGEVWGGEMHDTM